MKLLRVSLQSLATVLLLIGSTGCFTHQTMTSARTLNAGQTEVTASAAVLGPFLLPQANLQVRHGISDRVEVGGTLGNTGVGANVKLALLRPERADFDLNVSVDPTVHGFVDPTNPYAVRRMGAYLPLLLGFRNGGTEITFAPRFGWRREIGIPDETTPNDYSYFYTGATLGVALRVGGPFTVTPEVGVHAELGEYPSVIPSVGLGLTWGR